MSLVTFKSISKQLLDPKLKLDHLFHVYCYSRPHKPLCDSQQCFIPAQTPRSRVGMT